MTLTSTTTSVDPSGIVHQVLTEDNYQRWRVVMQNYLQGQGLWDVVMSTPERDNDILLGPQNRMESEEAEKTEASRKMKDAKALHIIRLSCGREILDEISHFKTAKSAWNYLSMQYGNDLEASRDTKKDILDERQKQLFKKVERGEDIGYISMDSDIWITTASGRTLLHVAVIAGNLEIVKRLVREGKERLVCMQDKRGYTALALAARYTGNIDIAKCMVEDKKYSEELLTMEKKTREAEIPILLAAANGHNDMTIYLYRRTPQAVFDNDYKKRVLLLSLCITAEIFDVALRLLKRYPDLPKESLCSKMVVPGLLRDSLSLPSKLSYKQESSEDKFSLLEALAKMPSAFRSGCQFSLWEKLIYNSLSVDIEFRDNYGIPDIAKFVQLVTPTRVANVVDKKRQKTSFLRMRWIWFSCKAVLMILMFLPAKLLGFLLRGTAFIFKYLNIFGVNKIYDRKYTHYKVLGILNYLCQSIEYFDELEFIEASAYESMLHASQHGNIEFINAMREANPSLLSAVDSDHRGIFSYAILNRKIIVFQLIHSLFEEKEIFRYQVDRYGNNLLHLTAYSMPSSNRDTRSGAALQMQREIQWFKAVEKVVHPRYKEAKNRDGKKPHELFTQNHNELVQAGEKWAKETAASFTIVGTLITTIMFAAAFTVPGGNNQDTGFPIFLQKDAFTTFLIADATSLFTAVASVLIFIGILTSRYAEKDFLMYLPLKLLFSLFFLFLSVCSMLVVFCATIIMISQGYRTYKWFVVAPSLSLGIAPITILLISQLRLMYEILHSTLKNPVTSLSKLGE